MKITDSDLQEILTHALETMKEEEGAEFELNKVNLAELSRRTNISRHKLRKLKRDGFRVRANGNKGRKAETTVMTGFTGVVDNLLKNNVVNSEVIMAKITPLGYKGSRSSLKNYISEHRDLIPASREVVSPQGNRGRRYTNGPGESYQMDWGFVNVKTNNGNEYRCACFVMICHHCGQRYVEFFPNAKQENLFIGMIHAFIYMGVPETVLTDNMKSVVIGRDSEGNPIWQKDYEVFMKDVGFQTKLCKVRHPFTKGAVERLVRFVKENFIVGKVFGNITDLNIDAFKWCREQNSRYHKGVDCIPADRHRDECMKTAHVLTITLDMKKYLCPLRRISFDGFVNYEGRRFGVPYWYKQKECRITREDFYIRIFDVDLTQEIVRHDVTWTRKDSFCSDQYADQPEELPTSPVKALMHQSEKIPEVGFEKFDFGKKVKWDD